MKQTKHAERHLMRLHTDVEVLEFTPSIGDNNLDGSGEGQAYTTQIGRGIRHGRWITFTVSVIISDLGTLAVGEAVRILGLPYPHRNLAIYNPVFPVYATSLAITDQSSLVARGIGGASEIVIYTYDLVTGTSVLTIAELSAAGHLQVSGTYETDDIIE